MDIQSYLQQVATMKQAADEDTAVRDGNIASLKTQLAGEQVSRQADQFVSEAMAELAEKLAALLPPS